MFQKQRLYSSKLNTNPMKQRSDVIYVEEYLIG